MNNRFSQYRPYVRAALCLIGLAGAGMCVIALAANRFGLEAQPGFGLIQLTVLIMGLLVMLLTGLLLLDLHLDSQPGASTAGALDGGVAHRVAFDWPTSKEAAFVFVLSLLVIAVDIHFSQQLGLLAYPPKYDGVYYMMEAKSVFYRLPDVAWSPLALTRSLLDNRFPVYQGLMILNFLLLGEGEWQSYAVRFWPTFLLVLLVFWVVRRRADTRMAAAATLCSIWLPTVGNGLHSTAAQYFSHEHFGWTWSMTDLRPDLLFAVLLLWSVVFLVEHAPAISRRACLASAAFAAMAVLTKASALPVLLLAWGSAILYVLIVNRNRLRLALRASVWGAAGFTFLLAPWVLAGGATLSLEYLYSVLTVHRSSYSNPNATFFSEATYYWTMFPRHMGVAGWIIVGLGLLCWLLLARKQSWNEWTRLLTYGVIAGVLYGIVSLTSAKNYHLGLPYYFVLWLFSWSAVGTVVGRLTLRHRAVSRIVLLVAIFYSAIVAGMGFYSLWRIPSEQRLDGPQNRQTTLQIAAEMRAHLANEDTFAWLPAYGFPNTLQYYMVDSSGGYPQPISLDAATLPPVDEYVQTTVKRCKAILVYEEDMEQVSQHLFTWTPRANWPYLRAIHDWVKQPDSPYRLVGTYYFYDRTGPYFRHLTLQLYVRQPQQAASGTR